MNIITLTNIHNQPIWVNASRIEYFLVDPNSEGRTIIYMNGNDNDGLTVLNHPYSIVHKINGEV